MSTSAISPSVKAEILRLGAYEVVLLGGSGVISSTMEGLAEALGM